MIPGGAAGRVLFLAARLLAASIFLVTWAYGVTTYSPFAFDMFVTPRLFSPLADFVTWHHVWFLIAVACSGLTLIPELRAQRGAAFYGSVGYLLLFGAVALYLLGAPYLSELSRESRNLIVVLGALLPLLWLAVIDHLSSPVLRSERQHLTTPQKGLFQAMVATLAVVWSLHLSAAWLRGRTPSGGAELAVGALWTLVLDGAILVCAYAALTLIIAVASTRARRFAWEWGLTTALAAMAIVELWRQIILPSFSFESRDAAVIAATAGVTLAMSWAGIRARLMGHVETTAIAQLMAVAGSGPGSIMAALILTPLLASTLVARVEPIDWASILQGTIAIVEAAIVFGACIAWRSKPRSSTATAWLIAGPPLAVVGVLAMLPAASLALARLTASPRLEPRIVVDRLGTADHLAGFAADRLFVQPGFDVDYFRSVLATESRQSTVEPALPERTLASEITVTAPGAARPHVFLFVIDSLRRDYLSPYNPAVTFTPAIDAWAREQYVFRNAFTAYGGTWLAMPALWSGSTVTRGWGRLFARTNLLEPLVAAGGYDFVVNDFTVATLLRQDVPRTFLDPDIKSVDTDLCRNLQSLQDRLDSRRDAAAPMFAFLAPMNVHILNTGIASQELAGQYPGFYAPYASRVQRMDRCFGSFIQFLKARQLYDQSIIVLTSDHGDSLGGDGRWGHQFHIFPETIRVPFIVQLPAAQRSTLTADLARVSFLTDVAPTLAALLGHPLRPVPGSGAPLFVPEHEMPDARRRQPFLVMSSYGSTYGVLRRNARFLYISDLLNWREFAFDLYAEPNGRPAPITDALRRVNQGLIRDQLDRVDELYRRR